MFYRVGSNDTSQGLWYNSSGEFTGLIHGEYNFCENSQLKMDYDEKVVGYLSAVDTLEHLFTWFTKEDLFNLKKYNYSILVYEAANYKWYEKFEHWLICQNSSQLIKIIEIDMIL